MIVRRNHPDSWKPWKNGGGLTREIAVYPVTANSENFLWRVSIAKIECTGPFSRFHNVSRRLMLLNGKGALFQFSNRNITLTNLGEAIDFSGDEDLHCIPVDGACLVLNVMTRGDQVCKMNVVPDLSLPATRGVERIIVLAEGAVQLIEHSNPSVMLQASDAVLISPNAQLQMEMSGGIRPTLIELTFGSS